MLLALLIWSSSPAVGKLDGRDSLDRLREHDTAMSSGSDARWLYSGFVCIVPWIDLLDVRRRSNCDRS